MAKQKGKSKGSKKKPADMPKRVEKHMDALGLSRQEYLSWCYHYGFPAHADKSAADLEKEAEFFYRLSTHNARIDRVLHNPRRLIESACAYEIDPAELSRPKWAAFCTTLNQYRGSNSKREQLKQLMLCVEERADFLFEQVEFGGELYQYVEALIWLNEKRNKWLRPLEDWRPNVRSRRRQFASLLRHLLARYPVPEFMDSAWFGIEGWTPNARSWFIHIGQGMNIREAKTPFPLTKRMAHQFLQAPASYNVLQALRWAEVHGLGGGQRLTEAILGTRIGETFANEEFWQTVILFFVNNPLLDRHHVGPIIDYLLFQKFDVQEIMIAPNVVERVPPPQPNFTMRGRTPEALLRQVEDWHAELNRTQPVHGLIFEPSGISPFSKKTDGGKEKWHIRELLSGSDLIKEGKALNHCVATYAESCKRGYSSIWTMERETQLGTDKTLTIEVQRHGMIVQVRGKHNRLPTREEIDVIRQWATNADLSISRYVNFL